jgi:hypothetical protein
MLKPYYQRVWIVGPLSLTKTLFDDKPDPQWAVSLEGVLVVISKDDADRLLHGRWHGPQTKLDPVAQWKESGEWDLVRRTLEASGGPPVTETEVREALMDIYIDIWLAEDADAI